MVRWIDKDAAGKDRQHSPDHEMPKLERKGNANAGTFVIRMNMVNNAHA